MTILVCLGDSPDTWWQAKNVVGAQVLERAEKLAVEEDVREAVSQGRIAQSLPLYEMEPSLRERVWLVVEEGARAVAAEEQAGPEPWPPEWVAHVADLAREMEARRLDPDRLDAWPAER